VAALIPDRFCLGANHDGRRKTGVNPCDEGALGGLPQKIADGNCQRYFDSMDIAEDGHADEISGNPLSA
jgi:hypothetical protein